MIICKINNCEARTVLSISIPLDIDDIEEEDLKNAFEESLSMFDWYEDQSQENALEIGLEAINNLENNMGVSRRFPISLMENNNFSTDLIRENKMKKYLTGNCKEDVVFSFKPMKGEGMIPTYVFVGGIDGF